MKKFAAIHTFFVLAACTCLAQSWQELSANVFTNTQIVWQIPTNTLPKSLWVYRRILPRVFPQTVISNALVLGSLQRRNIPASSTNDFTILKQVPENWPAPVPVLFGVYPKDANIAFTIDKFSPLSSNNIPEDKLLISLARKNALTLGLRPTDLTQSHIFNHWGDDEQGTNNIFGRGVAFPRCLDSFPFFSGFDAGDITEGFSVEFGEQRKVLAFSLNWSEVSQYSNERTFSEKEIDEHIRSGKMVIVPNFKPTDFTWLKSLSGAKRLTVTNATVFYNKGEILGASADTTPAAFDVPFVQLDALAETAKGGSPVKILCPIVKSPQN